MVVDINKTTVLDYGKPVFTIGNADTDGVTGKRTEWQNTKWKEQYGAFVNVGEYQNALLMKGIWNTGKGWTADSRTTIILNNLTGWGKDTWDDIIFNMDVTSMAGGDAYAQIIKVDNIIVNLKPLNPGTMKIIVNDEGRITSYEQMSRTNEKEIVKTYKPEEIFHLSYNRIADQIHGISIYDKLKKIILADEKRFEIMQSVMAYQAVPFIIWKIKTDDQTKIDNFVTRVRTVRQKYGDLFVPDDENIATWEVVSISPGQILMDWGDELRNKFYRAVGLPQIVPGGGEQGTGSESRTIYLAFEQLVAQRQLYLKRQIWSQLRLEVTFNAPTTMAELIGDTEQKTNVMGGMQMSELNPAADRQ